jgi:hypothetical protein
MKAFILVKESEFNGVMGTNIFHSQGYPWEYGWNEWDLSLPYYTNSGSIDYKFVFTNESPPTSWPPFPDVIAGTNTYATYGWKITSTTGGVLPAVIQFDF